MELKLATDWEKQAFHFLEVERRRDPSAAYWRFWFSVEFWDHEDDDGPLTYPVIMTIWEIAHGLDPVHAIFSIIGMFHLQMSLESDGLGVWEADFAEVERLWDGSLAKTREAVAA